MRFFGSSETAEASASASSSTPAPASASAAAPPPVPREIPADHPPIPDGVDACPVDDSAKKVWMTAPENPFHNSSSAPESSSSSSVRLANDREISTIPRGAGSMYSHNTDAAPVAAEHEAGGNWVYPSEQQFFNAMMRKKHNPQAKDMKTIVPIHNAVNEKAWEEVLVWEAGMGGEKCPGGIKLSSFVGRPQDRTPKAWMKTIFGYTPPFDRHDWYVDRCGTQVRYVIDFYTGKPDPRRPHVPSFYLDVRPAVDNWEGVRTRLNGLWK